MRRLLTSILVASAAWLLAGAAMAQEADACAKEREALDSINGKYQLLYDELSNRPGGPDPDLSGAGVVTWTRKEMSLDIPAATMKNRSFSMSTPQVTVKDREIIFDKPETRMVLKKIGERPVVKCRGIKCTVKMKPMYTKVPEVTMTRTRVITGVPEFRWETTSVIFKVPEFKATTRKIAFDYPEFAGSLTDPGTERAKEFEAIRAAHAKEAAPAIAALYRCQEQELIAVRTSVSAQFDAALGQLAGSIEAIQRAGGDPTAVPGDDGPVNLISERDRLVAQRTETLAGLDQGLAEIAEARRETYAAYGLELEA